MEILNIEEVTTGYNRTIEELKLGNRATKGISLQCYNRTIEELKQQKE